MKTRNSSEDSRKTGAESGITAETVTLWAPCGTQEYAAAGDKDGNRQIQHFHCEDSNDNSVGFLTWNELYSELAGIHTCQFFRIILSFFEGREKSMATKEIKNPLFRKLAEYGLITVSIWIMVVGIYFFKFPNNFAFGGVTGFSTVVSKMTRWTPGDFTFIVNTGLLVLGFMFLGTDVGIKTVYASMMMSFSLSALERIYPMHSPLTYEPMLELVFAIFLPAFGSAILFNIGASSGGTDIIAMILKKYTSMHIGTALLVVDIASVVMAFFVIGPTTGLYSTLGLMAKSLAIDGVIENINLCKCFNIICDDPDPICEFIIHDLKRSATVYKAQGAFTHHEKTVIMTTLKRSQAVKLRNYIKRIEPTAFILISNSSEIIGKGFLSN